jgi:hypothetical protein
MPPMTKEEIRQQLASDDAQFAEVIADLDASNEAKKTAIAGAGSTPELIARDQQAAADLAAGEQTHNDFVAEFDQAAADCASAAAAVTEPADAQAEIDLIAPIGPYVLADNNQATIQAVIDQLVTDLNQQITNIKAAAQKLNDELTNGSIGDLKESALAGAEALTSFSAYQQLYSNVAQVEAEVLTRLAEIEQMGQ